MAVAQAARDFPKWRGFFLQGKANKCGHGPDAASVASGKPGGNHSRADRCRLRPMHGKPAAGDANPVIGGANPAITLPNPTVGAANPIVTFANPTARGANPTVTFASPIIGFAPPTITFPPPTAGFAPLTNGFPPIFSKNGPFLPQTPVSAPSTPFWPGRFSETAHFFFQGEANENSPAIYGWVKCT